MMERKMQFIGFSNSQWYILGRNGSGKSTLMNIIAILQPSKGTVTINGIEIKNSKD